MIVSRRRLYTTYQFKLAGFLALLVSPDLVCSHVRGVEVGLCQVKDHPMYPGFRLILIILDVCLHPSFLVDREDIAVTSIIIEGITIDIVWWLLGSEDEDRARVGILTCCFRCEGMRVCIKNCICENNLRWPLTGYEAW